MSIKTSVVGFGESTMRGFVPGVGEQIIYDLPYILRTNRNFKINRQRAVAGQGAYQQTEDTSGPVTATNIAGTYGAIALVWFGITDAVNAIAVNTFKSRVALVVERCKRAGKYVVLLTPNKVNTSALYYDSTSVKDGLAVYQRVQENAEKVREVATASGATLIDVNALAVSLGDTLYPNSTGYTTILNAVLGVVTNAFVDKVNREAQVTLAFLATFQRAVAKGGLDFWQNQIGLNIIDYTDLILDIMTNHLGDTPYPHSQSHTTPPPQYRSQDFVYDVFVNVLGREPQPEGLAWWASTINEYQFIYSPESAFSIGMGEIVAGSFDYVDNGHSASQGIYSYKLIQNRMAVALAYAAIYSKTATDTPLPAGVLAGVTDNPATVVTATAGF